MPGVTLDRVLAERHEARHPEARQTGGMDRTELRALMVDFTRWSRQAAAVQRRHGSVQETAEAAERLLESRAVVVQHARRNAWRVVPLERKHGWIVGPLRERAVLPTFTRGDQALIRLLTVEVPRARADVNAALGLRRYLAGPRKRQRAEASAAFLRRQHDVFIETGWPQRLEELSERTVDESVGFEALVDPALGVVPEDPAHSPEVIERSALDGLAKALAAIDRIVQGEAEYRAAARDAAILVRRVETMRVLREMSTDALKTATRDRLRLGGLAPAGIHTVAQVLADADTLPTLPGLGEVSARHILGAAQTLRHTTFEETPVRIDVTRRSPEVTELLRCLAEWDARRRTRGAAADLERAAELAPIVEGLTFSTTHLLVVPLRELPVGELWESIDVVRHRAEQLRRTKPSGYRTRDPWEDFLARPADYFAMLSELGFLTGDEEATHGNLPDDIVKAVRDQPLNGEHLKASLRGYQSFAVRFVLVQRKVIIGDEMGLGKTFEAIAVLAHLRSRGENRFVVVCPAAVVTNWVREVTGKSTLSAHRVHGADRDHAARVWERDGGVAVTTFETLAAWQPGPNLACVVVDEAHYIKNPNAQRSVRTAAIVERAARAVLLTGTPLENKVSEFRSLASYVRPDLTVDSDGAALSAKAFRRQIAPAYLRRNQEDVLSELPGLVEVDEWLPLSTEDAAAYRAAVDSGNFMEMRQAAMRQGAKSEKVRRLVEIVREAEENERKVIVFSYFRGILDLVAKTLRGPVFGPLTGSVGSDDRQRMVDEFSAARHGATLVSQIVAGGVGLNVQAASVVIFCEPQLKPTIEAQAIARAHRMGQVRSVQVHRLLSEESVDQRIVELLEAKRKLFEDFARGSDIADAAPDAVDLSEAELAREVVASERKRLLNS
ncbi:helicase SNF2 [Virgisporangium ochraceum]|uniref:Helicase SNF2 n=2 Tax=Virgisporangium ochraceum TaxID=65505 RepID=A0A8J4E868_9ACTN|nr:helicase SNF2 [Virgisporangium ochraceum]